MNSLQVLITEKDFFLLDAVRFSYCIKHKIKLVSRSAFCRDLLIPILKSLDESLNK